jgi:hypothetical protein
MNLDELAFISLTKSDKALFGFKPLEYEWSGIPLIAIFDLHL